MSAIKTATSSFSWRLPELRWPVSTDVGPGLQGVIACGTEVSWLDPESGTLAYRGVPIEELAGSSSFEEVAFLLISGKRAGDDPQGFTAFRQRLRSSRALPAEVVELVRGMERHVHPTRLLRAGMSAVGCHELSTTEPLAGTRHWRELRMVGQMAALVGVIASHRLGHPPAKVGADASLAHGVLLGLLGREPAPEEVQTLDLLWVLYADHGLDAPSFTSLIVASCLADPYYNIVAGLSALRGPRLGGAGEEVQHHLLALDSEDRARHWVHERLDAGERIPGFGHRLYHMPDPRVVILRKRLAALARRKGQERLFTVARAVEDEATRLLSGRGVHVNINFYASLLFHLLGADGPLVPCLYVVGRMAGLVARVHEALEHNRIYRPRSRYVGAPERRVTPLEERS